MLTAQQLAYALRQQAGSNGQVRIDDALLGISGFDDLVRRNLQRDDGAVLLLVDPATIPLDPPAAGFTLAGASVPSGADGFLNLDGRAASIAFAFGSSIDVTLTLQPQQLAGGAAADWALGSSFPEIAFEPYDQLALTGTALVLASAQADQGLRLACSLVPDGILRALADLLQLKAAFPLDGDLLRDAKGQLAFRLVAELNIAPFGIDGILTLEQPRVVVQYATTTGADGIVQHFTDVALAATISAGSASDGQVVLDVTLALPLSDPESPLIQLSVMPRAFSASLLSLGSLVGGQSWNAFFSGPAQELKPYFDTFGFIGYNMTLTTSAQVNALTLVVGTLKPWPLWDAYTLSLSATWDVTFLRPGTVQTLLLHAGFDYDGKMQFDVDVYLPSLHITGRQSGAPIVLSLADVNKALFGGDLNVPADLLTIAVGNFWIDIDKASRQLGIGAIASASIALFGTRLLTVEDMAISVAIDASGPAKSYSATLDGVIGLGPIRAQVNAALSSDPKVGCTFTVHLVDETVGTMLGHLVRLVDPTYTVSFGAPWDKLLDISLDALVLKVDITNKKVEIDYVKTIDLGFLTLTQLGISWQQNAKGPSTTRITLAGNLLGVEFGGDSGKPPLAWDPINDNPPAVPGGGDKLLDLRYVGIGQHVGFAPSWQPANVEAVIAKLEQLALPAGGSNLPNLTSPDGLRFRSDSSWLVGADFTVLGTVKLAFVFNDPNLYGLLISLAGERAKSFAGLKFEILYRKVTDTIGVYHIELQLPDAMRHLEFGAVSLTLPQVTIDIYSNGNFRIDLGFPKGLDFSNSFCLQVFPFIGYGGFYFALLDGDTSSRVPRISNGRFDPVIEFGIALSVGVGKTIDEGILSGGLSVVVVGIVEGVIGWFNPSDAAVDKAEYYWLQGTVSIVGRLYGTIDFYIIQASVSVTAYASVIVVIEAHQPILISMSVGVSVQVSIKIVFFTIHCSFSATVSASFSIGSASPTPWVLASGSSAPARLQLFANSAGVHAPQQRMHADFSRLARRQLIQRRLDAGDITLDWQPQTVFATPRAVTLHAMPAFTRANGGVAGVMLLGIGNGIPARAAGLRAHTAPQAGAAEAGIGDVLEGLVRCAILNARATLGETDATLVSHDDVALLARAFADDATLAAALSYGGFLNTFLALNYRFTIAAPAAQANGDETGVAVFPMPPVLSMTAGAGAPLDFGAYNALDATTLEKMRAYFALLAVDYEQFVAQSGDAAAAMVRAAAPTPMAQVVFEQYFAMLMRSVVKAAGDVMQSLPFSLDQPFGIAQVRAALGDPGLPALNVVSPNRAKAALLAQGSRITFAGVRHQVTLGESFASVAAAFNKVLPADAQLSAAGLAQRNAANDALLGAGISVAFGCLAWTSLAGESVNLIVTRLLARAAPQSFLQQLPGLQTQAQALLEANPAVFPTQDPIAALRLPIDPVRFAQLAMPPHSPFGPYATVAGDTFTSVAASLIGLAGGLIDNAAAAAWVIAHNALPSADPAAPLPAGLVLALPPVVHTLLAGDSIDSLADMLMTTPATVTAALLALPPATALLAPQAMLDLPDLAYAVRADDSFTSLASLFNLSLDGLAATLDASQTPVFAANAQIIVADAEQMTVKQLLAALAATQWRTIAPMASRFMLSGLRLPDPADSAFRKLTLEQMREPHALGAIATLPLYAQTGQQFALAPPLADNYQFTLAPDGKSSWIVNPAPLAFPLSSEQRDVIAAIGGAAFAPPVSLAALPLFRLAPTRYTLQRHLAWQPASLPVDAVYAPAAAGSVTGSPDIWMFPDALCAQLQADGAAQPPYALSIGTQETAGAGMSVRGARAYAWATAVRVGVQQLSGAAAASASGASTIMVTGVDDSGLALLDAVLAQLGHDDATLFLLYSPNPASTASGMFSDDLGAPTALVQTNLSTLSHSAAPLLRSQRSPFLLDQQSGAPTYVAPLAQAAAFVQMLWECSIVRSGGYYLRYAAPNGALPAALFSKGAQAELTLLIVLKSQNGAHAPMLPFNNCAIAGDNLDPGTSNVFVQPATWLVPGQSSLSDAQAYALQTFGLALDAAAIATINADVPQLLRPGALAEVPSGTDAVRLDDTLGTLAARNGLTPAALASYAGNAHAALLAPTGLLQFSAGALSRAPAIAAGNAGFQLNRPNPDPSNALQATAMDGDSIVAELFHMLAQRVVPNVAGPAGFYASGAAVPTGPAQSLPTENGANAPSDTLNDHWDYHQAVAIAPFALNACGSRSPALPAAARNPYAGVDAGAQVTLAFEFADPYGNTLPMPGAAQTLSQPVRYFDELLGMARWPATALAYTLSGDGSADPALQVALSMQLDKYCVSPTVSPDSALRNAATDRATYARVYYQLAQPDVGFTVATTLEAPPVQHALSPTEIQRFVMSAWTVLDALCATRAAVFSASGGETLGDVAARHTLAPAGLFNANGAALYASVFGAAPLDVPQLYTTVAGDTLNGIAKAREIDAQLLVRQNPWALLDPANDLVAPPRPLIPGAGDTLAALAAASQCSVSGLATANPQAALRNGLALAVAGAELTTDNDSFATLVGKFSGLQRNVTLGEIALANQNVAGLFATPVTLSVDDLLPSAHDSFGSLAQRFGVPIATLAAANATVPNLFAAGTSLYLGVASADAPAAGTTLAHFAANQPVPLAALGLARWDGLAPAPAVNAGAVLAPKAVLALPASIENQGHDRHAVYRSQTTDSTLTVIAAKFAGNDASVLGTLNIDLPGLFLAGAPVLDAASGATVTSLADSTFASLVSAFAQAGHTVTPASLARDNATTTQLVRPGACWITPPMCALAQSDGQADTLARIAARYASSVAGVARTNAGTLGLLAPGVALPPFAGIAHTTGQFDTFNALIGLYTPPGGTAPTLDALAAALADVALIAPGALILPPPVAWSASVQIAPAFAEPIVELKVAITERRNAGLIADDFKTIPGIGLATVNLPPQAAAGQAAALSLDALANAVETALPGVRVATGAADAESDNPGQHALWIVNFGNRRGPAIGYRFDPASTVRSFAIPPLSTSLVSGQVPVTPYVSGTGLSGAALPLSFAGIDLDVWGATFLEAMDRMLAPDYAVPAQEISLAGFDTIVSAKRTLAAAVAGRVQYVLGGQGPGEYGQTDPRRADAITAMEQALLQQLSSAYLIEGVVQASVEVDAPFIDARMAPRLSGRASLSPGDASARLNNASLSTAKVVLADTGAPVLASFLLSLQAPASARMATVNIGYEVAQIERPTALPDSNGYQTSTWLTLVHPADSATGSIAGAVLPISLRAYPLPPTLVGQNASASIPVPLSGNDLVRWNADATWTHQDADQDQCALRIDVGTAAGDALDRQNDAGNVDALFAALAQFITVWPALGADAGLLAAHRCGSPASAATVGAVAAFAALAAAVAAAWPTTAAVTPPRLTSMAKAGTEIVPGTYAYTLTRAPGSGPDLSTLLVRAASANPAPLWPVLAVDASGTGMAALTLQSSKPSQAVYAYPAGVPRDSALQYQATVAGLDAVMVPNFTLSASVVRNADLVDGVQTSPLFVYQTPYTAFPAPLIPLLQVDHDVDIGSGSIDQLAAALQAFLQSLLTRSAATGNLERTLKIAVSYGYELLRQPAAAGAVRGARSAVAAAETRLVPLLPIALLPSVKLLINGDHQASIDTLAQELAAFIAIWDSQTQPSHTNAALFFDISLFSANDDSSDKPLMMARSVRYVLAGA
jgi:hypothetical protein